MWADALRVAAFGSAAGGSSCGHGAKFLLPVQLLMEMPGPLALALAGVLLEPPEGPWPDWARTDHPIDWPALIAGDPDHLTWDHGMLAANMGASGDGVTAAYRLLDDHGLNPYMDVCLWIQPDGRFSAEPTTMWSEPSDLKLSRQVDDILVASGRPRKWLRYEDQEAPWFWRLNA
ncbi:hypothetical protein ABZV91_29355 [Nocardia sp. NPDC004568]|uniref:hypothetical protein n=1 Tax=Nocardia sp. NPDC004568 TaxID=3154551 RepID=UPI0033BCA057